MTFMEFLLIGSGCTQIAIAATSTVVPKVLDWKGEMAKVSPLTRNIFWTYAAYILCINITMGVFSIIGHDWLLSGETAARTIAGFPFVYWGARAVLQFVYYDIESVPKTFWMKVGVVLVDIAFVCLTIVYGLIAFGVR